MLTFPVTVFPVMEVVGEAAWSEMVEDVNGNTREKTNTRQGMSRKCPAGCLLKADLLLKRVAVPRKHRSLRKPKGGQILRTVRKRSNRAKWREPKYV